MAELKINEQPSAATEIGTPPELRLVREACSFFANAGQDLATHISIVVSANSSQDAARMAERIAEEYGLRARTRTNGRTLILDVARAARAQPEP
ncbi:MAG TPA: hypothetical protein VFZ12_02120 [Dehalococcoidia bacterium]|nr:hypothetical protein [Dehalococcoidia bacterium]